MEKISYPRIKIKSSLGSFFLYLSVRSLLITYFLSLFIINAFILLKCDFNFKAVQYDIATQSYIGKATVPLAKSMKEVNATHAFIYMLVGISSRYKQIVAYDFTGASINGQHFHDKVMAIVIKSEDVGLKCNGMISDMGGPNGALWKLLGVKGNLRSLV